MSRDEGRRGHPTYTTHHTSGYKPHYPATSAKTAVYPAPLAGASASTSRLRLAPGRPAEVRRQDIRPDISSRLDIHRGACDSGYAPIRISIDGNTSLATSMGDPRQPQSRLGNVPHNQVSSLSLPSPPLDMALHSITLSNVMPQVIIPLAPSFSEEPC